VRTEWEYVEGLIIMSVTCHQVVTLDAPEVTSVFMNGNISVAHATRFPPTSWTGFTSIMSVHQARCLLLVKTTIRRCCVIYRPYWSLKGFGSVGKGVGCGGGVIYLANRGHRISCNYINDEKNLFVLYAFNLI